MQDLMDEYRIDENNVDIKNVADFLINFIFSSVHSTSLAFTYCLHGKGYFISYIKEGFLLVGLLSTLGGTYSN